MKWVFEKSKIFNVFELKFERINLVKVIDFLIGKYNIWIVIMYNLVCFCFKFGLWNMLKYVGINLFKMMFCMND